MVGIAKRISLVSRVALFSLLTLGLLSNESLMEKAAHQHKHTEPSIVPSEVKGTLVTSRDTGVKYSGTFKGADSPVSLQSQQTGFDNEISPRTPEAAFMGSSSLLRDSVTTADSIQASLTVNGKRIDITEDLNEGIVRLDPHGQKLTQEDLAAINGAYYDFEGRLAPLMESAREENVDPNDANPYDEHPRLDPANPLDPQDDLLVRLLMFLSEAPVRVPLEDQLALQPKPGDFKMETAIEAVSEVSSRTPISEESSVSELTQAACKNEKDFAALNLVACLNPNDNDNYIHTCATTTRTTQHDDGKHCFKTYRVTSGPHTTRSKCFGRCGKGCGKYNGLGIYTLDCLDHDHAVRHSGSYTTPYVQDEFRWTFDDVNYGENNPNRRCRK